MGIASEDIPQPDAFDRAATWLDATCHRGCFAIERGKINNLLHLQGACEIRAPPIEDKGHLLVAKSLRDESTNETGAFGGLSDFQVCNVLQYLSPCDIVRSVRGGCSRLKSCCHSLWLLRMLAGPFETSLAKMMAQRKLNNEETVENEESLVQVQQGGHIRWKKLPRPAEVSTFCDRKRGRVLQCGIASIECQLRCTTIEC